MSEEKSLLVEILTEELPPKALKELAVSLSSSVYEELAALGLVAKTATFNERLATPRRLAVLISAVSRQAEVREREIQGPSTSAPQAAAAGFARKHGLAVEALLRQQTPKGEDRKSVV